MRRLCATFPALLVLVVAAGLGADAAGHPLGRGLQAVQSMAGCYLVDYSYTEVESLKPGYTRDARVYDVNRDKSAQGGAPPPGPPPPPRAPAAHLVPPRPARPHP